VVACDLPLKGERAYYLVSSERSEERPVVKIFMGWLAKSLALPPQA